MKNRNKFIEIATKMNIEKQNQKLRILSKIDNSKKIEIMKIQKKLFHSLKEKHKDIDNETLTLSSLILAIDSFIQETKEINLKAIKLRTKNQRQHIKRDRILQYWSIVKTLKNDEKLSFREISEYLKKYHKFNVSYSFIYQIWNEIENNIKKENNHE